MRHRHSFISSLMIAVAVLPLMNILQLHRAEAQGLYYWGQTYGTRSNLLGGTVIGSVTDVSATYYNPGALGLIENPEIILTAQVSEYNRNELSLEGYEEATMASNKVSASPSFFAGSLGLDSADIHKIFFSYLMREKRVIDAEARSLNPSPIDDVDYVYNPLLRESFAWMNLTESWFGLSYGYKATPLIGLGATMYVAVRSSNTRMEYHGTWESTTGDLGSAALIDDVNYFNARLLWKIGAAVSLSRWRFGVTVTTPGVNVLGWGDAYLNRTITGFDIEGDGVRDDYFAATNQDDKQSLFRSPWAIGFGAYFGIDRSKLHFSCEWYNAVESFRTLDLDPVVSYTGGDTLSLSAISARDAIINFGFGFEYFINDRISIFGSAITDFYAPQFNGSLSILTSPLDVYHLTTGVTLMIGKSEVTAGLEFAHGSKEIQTSSDLTRFNGAFRGLGDLQPVTGQAKYFKIKLIVAASFHWGT